MTTPTGIDAERALTLATAIRVKPTVVWRMQRPENGAYCMEWSEHEERAAREYYSDQVNCRPDHAGQYEIKRVEYFTAHDERCNEAADLLETIARKEAAPVPAGMADTPSKFKVRDRVQDKHSGRTATVIALTAQGFRYFFDERWELGPRHGFVDEGESFDDSHWEAAPQPAIQAAAEVTHIPPILPQILINLIGEYGMARTDGVSPLEVQHRWELLIKGIKAYALLYAQSRLPDAQGGGDHG